MCEAKISLNFPPTFHMIILTPYVDRVHWLPSE